MEPRKLTSADIDKVRGIEGFPIATDEAIIELSDAPYYTACPNPFIEEFIAECGAPYDETTDGYHREPFTADVSEGKNEPIYLAHSYHTKVPYKAIMRYLLHYTEPGDVIYDGFAGTGMTGVAAQMCANPDRETRLILSKEVEGCKWGVRHAVLGDLSPAATFISNGFNSKTDFELFGEETKRILRETSDECSWMYETTHNANGQDLFGSRNAKGTMNYIVWSDIFICPHCGAELVFWDVALDKKTKRVSETFSCPECRANLRKAECERAREFVFDTVLHQTVEQAKLKPVLMNYSFLGKRYEKIPDAADIELISHISQLDCPCNVPLFELPEGFNTDQPRRSHGIQYAHQFYTNRTLYILSVLWDKATHCQSRTAAQMVITGIMQISSKMSRFRYDSRNPNNTAGGTLNGTLYIPSLQREGNVFQNYERRLSAIRSMVLAQRQYGDSRTAICQVSSATESGLPSNSIDYIFTDPPFGSNINYSELSTIWEAWLGVATNNKQEAIINSTQHKSIVEYQNLMADCFAEYYRVLKPGRWMTVEFHNSKNAVWNAIQEALQRAGFIIADVRTLDKRQGSFKQTTTTTAVKQDLVISAYKPIEQFVREFEMNAGSEETAWAFVNQYLEYLPVVVKRGDSIETIAERQSYLLYDRMIAFHITRALPVPIDATDFYRGLDDRYISRDGMYFLANQINEYDDARIQMDVEEIQFALFVTNERTAIGWLYQLLSNKPQTYAEIQPQFMQEVKKVDRYEAMPELAVLLEENFLQDDKGRWYVPDTKKEGDVAKLREKSLLREFDGYLKSKGKLKLFRSEAIRVGFSHLWKDKNYQAIVDLANRLPAATIQEDPNLLMYYDISLSRVG